MVVGALGEMVFQVSHETVQTVKNMTWSGSERVATHERHNWHALTEYTGIDPDKITLSIYLSKYLGTDPMEELRKLWRYEREGLPVSLVLGDHAYGKYRWLVRRHSTSMENHDYAGNLAACTVTVELLEYLKD